MKYIDYYKILGLDNTASADDIKRAYYKLAKKYHPDRNENDELSLVKFTLINEAFNILGDLENRLRYKIDLEKREHIHQQAKIKMKLLKRIEQEENEKNEKKNSR